MGRIGSASVARTQGADTGAALHALGIDIDFAPVADIATTNGFMYRDGRTWSISAVKTALLADAFATGLESKGVVPSMKHFPGLAFATRNTDAYAVTIGMSRLRLAPGLKPYRTAIGHHIPMIMLSNATYPAYDRVNAAGWSHAISTTLLRGGLGFKGVTITDSLTGTANARGRLAQLPGFPRGAGRDRHDPADRFGGVDARRLCLSPDAGRERVAVEGDAPGLLRPDRGDEGGSVG